MSTKSNKSDAAENTVISIAVSPETLAIIALACKDGGVTPEIFLSEQVEKLMASKEVAFARQRLNLHKKTVAQMISLGAKGYESLEDCYIGLGLSESVETFGGINKVYTEIFLKSGLFIGADKIRANHVEFVPKSA